MSLRGVNGLIYIDEFTGIYHKHLNTYTIKSIVFGDSLHYAEPISYPYSDHDEIIRWCYRAFGSPGYHIDTHETVWDFTNTPFRFWFSDEKNLMLFVLRWS